MIKTMASKKANKIPIKKKTTKKPTHQQPSTRILNPIDIWEDVNRLFYDDPWLSPWWGHWKWHRPESGLLIDSVIVNLCQ
ncbi:MAG: hypothetical protein KKG04_03900 [Candidatus Thermoplasmatota archaeon]|nr:hypothetical protein [Candidatus Thermoplasmatota archaeon]